MQGGFDFTIDAASVNTHLRELDSVLKSGAERAARLANRTVSKVYRKVGLMQLDK